MNKHLKIGIISVLGLVTFACSSPEKDAKSVAKIFISNMASKDSCKDLTTLKELLSKSTEATQSEIQKFQQKYESSPEKMTLFHSTYRESIKAVVDEYSQQCASIINEQFNKLEWYQKKGSTNGYHLFSFKNDSLFIINCKKGVSYSFLGDTICFDDDNKTKKVISIDGDNIIFESLESDKKSTMVPPEERAKFFGNWSWGDSDFSLPLTLSSNGSFSLNLQKVGRGKMTGSWYIKNGKIKIGSFDAEPYRIINNNHIACSRGLRMYRITKDFPSSLEDIF